MISIIVPVYNTEKYLDQCIQSVLAQTYTNWELLLIDDGSTDSSGAICDKYAAEDKRIRVFHKENGGVSSARNLGLDNAKGEWISFVDADDWIEPQSLHTLFENRDSDLIIASMHFEHSGYIGNFPRLGKLESQELNDLLAKNMDHFSICSPCSKYFKNRIIQEQHLRFNQRLCFGEDSVFVKTYLLNVKNITCVKDVCYHYQDIGNNIYHKYSTSFVPILLYYKEMLKIYDRFEKIKMIAISRHSIVGVVFNIAHICLLKNGLNDIQHIRFFLADRFAYSILWQRQSVNIRIMLLLSRLPQGFMLLLYAKLINGLKSILRSS